MRIRCARCKGTGSFKPRGCQKCHGRGSVETDSECPICKKETNYGHVIKFDRSMHDLFNEGGLWQSGVPFELHITTSGYSLKMGNDDRYLDG